MQGAYYGKRNISLSFLLGYTTKGRQGNDFRAIHETFENSRMRSDYTKIPLDTPLVHNPFAPNQRYAFDLYGQWALQLHHKSAITQRVALGLFAELTDSQTRSKKVIEEDLNQCSIVKACNKALCFAL